jgi:hypothetical protein
VARDVNWSGCVYCRRTRQRTQKRHYLGGCPHDDVQAYRTDVSRKLAANCRSAGRTFEEEWTMHTGFDSSSADEAIAFVDLARVDSSTGVASLSLSGGHARRR